MAHAPRSIPVTHGHRSTYPASDRTHGRSQYRDGVDDTEAGIDREIAEMFDPSPSAGSACRVCGALVAPVDEYQRIHWEWHEASNGV